LEDCAIAVKPAIFSGNWGIRHRVRAVIPAIFRRKGIYWRFAEQNSRRIVPIQPRSQCGVCPRTWPPARTPQLHKGLERREAVVTTCCDAPPTLSIPLRFSGRGALANLRCGFASVMRPSIRGRLGAHTKPCIAWPPCTVWFCPRKARFFVA
jgi:hypothetical protein